MNVTQILWPKRFWMYFYLLFMSLDFFLLFFFFCWLSLPHFSLDSTLQLCCVRCRVNKRTHVSCKRLSTFTLFWFPLRFSYVSRHNLEFAFAKGVSQNNKKCKWNIFSSRDAYKRIKILAWHRLPRQTLINGVSY